MKAIKKIGDVLALVSVFSLIGTSAFAVVKKESATKAVGTATAQKATQVGESVIAPQAVVPVLAPKLTVNATTSYFEMQGHKGDDNRYYDFEKLNARIDLLSVNYGVPGGWSANLLMQHYEFYTETLFPQMAQFPEYFRSNDRTRGAGDTYLMAIAPMKMLGSWIVVPEFGVSIPTGGINYKSHLPGLEKANLAYNAQHGSGTYDLLLGATAVLPTAVNLTYGHHVLATFRTGKNNNDYTLGNMYRYDTWLDYNLVGATGVAVGAAGFGLTPRLVGFYRHKDPIRGFDKTRNTFDGNGNSVENPGDQFYHNPQKDWSVSAAVKASQSFLNSQLTLSAELGVPVAQDNLNSDNSEVQSKYYGSLGVTGSF